MYVSPCGRWNGSSGRGARYTNTMRARPRTPPGRPGSGIFARDRATLALAGLAVALAGACREPSAAPSRPGAPADAVVPEVPRGGPAGAAPRTDPAAAAEATTGLVDRG